MVTWVCVKESSSIQSGCREGKVNLRKETESTKKPIKSFHIRDAAVHVSPSLTLVALAVLPQQVEHGGEEQLVVDGDAHVARLVEGRGHRPDGGPQGASPAQEQKLGWWQKKK